MGINRTIPSWKYDSMYIEHWASPVNDLYHTREDLEEAKPGNINWTLWDQLVDKTKKQIQEMLLSQQGKEVEKATTKHIWVYQTNGKLVGEFKSVVEAGTKLDINPESIYQAVWRKKPFYSKQLFFSYHQLDEKELEALKRMKAGKLAENGYGKGGKPQAVQKWVYNLKGELLGHYYSTDAVAEAFNIERGAVNYYSWKQEPYYKKEILILSHPLKQEQKE